jgi:hypothetical protein
MSLEFTSINTQYNNDAIAAIMQENASAAASAPKAVEEANHLDIDGAIVSISKTGAARINAMLNKSILLITHAASNVLNPADRIAISAQKNDIRYQINEIQDEDAAERVAEIREKMLNNANDSLNALIGVNRDCVLHLL